MRLLRCLVVAALSVASCAASVSAGRPRHSRSQQSLVPMPHAGVPSAGARIELASRLFGSDQVHSIVHEEEALTPMHLTADGGQHHDEHAAAPRHHTLHKSTPFVKAPWPYTHADPPCTTYARQDNCAGYPPLAPEPLPACGAFSGITPNTTVFAIIGDFGLDGNCETIVHDLVKKMEQQFGTLAFIMTTGDNAYWGGSCESLQSSVVAYYGNFLPNDSAPQCTNPMKQSKRGYVNPHYTDNKHFDEQQEKMSHELHRLHRERERSQYSDNFSDGEPMLAGRHVNTALPRFFPTMGNHDWSTYGHVDPQHMPYFQIFDYLMDFPPSDLAHGQFFKVSPIPGLELYSLNSNLGASDATPLEQDLFVEQVNWLKATLMNSTAAFKLVYFHHPPFCTAQHDPLAAWMDLDYEEWGASAVWVGHQHVYERLTLNRARGDGQAPTMPYIVNGLGGHPWTYQIEGCPAYPGSQVRYNTYHGAQVVVHSWNETTHAEQLDVCFYSLENGGTLVDHFEIEAAA